MTIDDVTGPILSTSDCSACWDLVKQY